ncbi:MAG TPA: hypothetical protein VGB77_17020 [Abditibacteriaceae bacterium]|jgi:triacylglycerol esterase/lipase EstA (alpha/beta hydrolase family)
MKQSKFTRYYFVWFLCNWLCASCIQHVGADALIPEPGNPPTGTPLILMHGWMSNSKRWDKVVRVFRNDGSYRETFAKYRIFRFDYDFTQAIETSGINFFLQVKAKLAPDEKFVIVAHSMGGLVARSALENFTGTTPHLHERLIQLITLATPHHGSPIANLAWLKNDSKIDHADPVLFLLRENIFFKNLNTDGGSEMGWDNSDGGMPEKVWQGYRGRIFTIPPASRFTQLLNQHPHLTEPEKTSLTARYTVVGSYHETLPDWQIKKLISEIKGSYQVDTVESTRLLAIRVVLGRYFQNGGEWVKTYTANDGVVPLSSALFINDAEKISQLSSEKVNVGGDEDLGHLSRAHAVKVFANIEHAQLPDSPQVWEFIASQLKAIKD